MTKSLRACALVRFTIPAGDPGTRHVRAILRTHIAHESTRSLRRFLVHLLAALGGFMVVYVLFPNAMSDDSRRTLLGIWAVCALAAAGAAVVEWRLRREETRLLADERDTPPTEGHR